MLIQSEKSESKPNREIEERRRKWELCWKYVWEKGKETEDEDEVNKSSWSKKEKENAAINREREQERDRFMPWEFSNYWTVKGQTIGFLDYWQDIHKYKL